MKLKSMNQAFTKAGIDDVLDRFNLDDLDASDTAAELIALQMFTLHNINKKIEPGDYNKQRLEAFTFTNCIHRRLIDFIDTMEEGKL